MKGTRIKDDIRTFWNEHPCGAKFAAEDIGSPAFFDEVEHHRYALEPHILEMAPFDEARGKRVLELGCGIGTDGAQFSRKDGWYIGSDMTERAVRISQQRFRSEGLHGNFVILDAESLPYSSDRFDIVYSHGVLHHTPDTERAFSEVHRVLKAGGKAVIMVYHRSSWNYHIGIKAIRRLGVELLRFSWGPRFVHRLTGEAIERLEQHQAMLKESGSEYLTEAAFLSQNTDGPGNPLSKVYTRQQLRRMLHLFSEVRTCVRFLRRDRIPVVGSLLPNWLDSAMGRAWGWHLYAVVTK